jgi:hypothetical protein
MRFNLSAVLVAVFCVNLFATDFFTDRGSWWLGGGCSYSADVMKSGNSLTAMHSFGIGPSVRFFPCKYLFIGPALSWSGMYSTNSENFYNVWGAGVEAGFAYGKNEHIIPYFRTGVTYTYEKWYSLNAIAIPVAVGLMIPLFDGVGLQVDAGYDLLSEGSESQKSHIFGISVGFCGIGKKSALSLLGRL